jgi:hypothetical protein
MNRRVWLGPAVPYFVRLSEVKPGLRICLMLVRTVRGPWRQKHRRANYPLVGLSSGARLACKALLLESLKCEVWDSDKDYHAFLTRNGASTRDFDQLNAKPDIPSPYSMR